MFEFALTCHFLSQAVRGLVVWRGLVMIFHLLSTSMSHLRQIVFDFWMLVILDLSVTQPVQPMESLKVKERPTDLYK